MSENLMTDSRQISPCWCGCDGQMDSVHPEYEVCTGCGTARYRRSQISPPRKVEAEEADLYGKAYWFEHMRALGLPDIQMRARLDLAERCQYWLRFLLKYRLPPGRVLEVACAHGGFIKLLSTSGYHAVGMEMSPWIVNWAKASFGVEVVQGPVECVDFGPEAFDVLCMFDVFEHFTDPVNTMKSFARMLKDDGLMVLQTPEFTPQREETWGMFKTPEHVFLYSRESMVGFLTRIGLKHVAFESAIFGSDMFAFCSRLPLQEHSIAEIEGVMQNGPDRRLSLAMQDLFSEVRRLRDDLEHLPDSVGVRGLLAALSKSLMTWPRRALARVRK